VAREIIILAAVSEDYAALIYRAAGIDYLSHSVRNKPTEEALPAASEPSQPDPSKGGFRLEVIKKE